MADNNKQYKNKSSQSAYLVNQLGKVPPQVIELEEAVLGALMIEKDALTDIIDVLKPNSFYKPAHQEIYQAIFELFSESQPVDMLTVTQQLRKMAKLEMVGGPSYIMKLTSLVNSAANIEYHARIITEQAIKRDLIAISSEIQKEAFEDSSDVFDLLDKAEQALFDISENNIRKNYADMRTIMQDAIRQLEERRDQDDGLTGVPSGLTELDRVTAGWQKSDLVILAARPAMGKTAFSLTILRNAAVDFGKPAAFFSLEMSAVQLTNRLISSEAQIESEKIKKGQMQPHEWEILYQKIATISEAPIFIDDTPALSILELRAKCRRLKAQHDIQLVIIDYLQLMTGNTGKGGAGNREQEIASISRALKQLAKELDIPVIALSQLSRAVETRGGDKRPQLSDLRESGCLTGDTLISDAQTGELIPIKELAERDKQEPFQVFGIDKGYKVTPQKAIKAFYSGRKKVFELRTASGRKIKASANHPFLKLEGWTKLEQLNVGDHLAVPRQLNIRSVQETPTDDELILLAHLIGDGCILPRSPYHYTSADSNNLEIVSATAKRLFGIEGRLVQQDNWYHVYLPSPYHLTHGVRHPITNWYNDLEIERVRSYNKQVPANIFKLSTKKIALFLHHIWATDGNISHKRSEGRKISAAIYYGSSSEKLAFQVQHLLLRLGILSTLREALSKKGYRTMYQVHITGVLEQTKFLEIVGCFGDRGSIIPEILENFKDIKPNPNNDSIPKEAWQQVIEPAKDRVGMSWREFSAGIDTAYSGSSLFKRGISRKRMERIQQILPDSKIKALTNSDILWDKITSIIELDEEDVYDITVERVHNFVANDIIVHNSIEQDADMVAFLYRAEYYGLTEDATGNSTAGVGEIMIAKHRNGSLADIPLKFIGKYTKFENLDTDTFGMGMGDMGSSFPSGGSSEFDMSNAITLGSKVNQPETNNASPENPPDRPSESTGNIFPPSNPDDEPPF